MKKYLFIILLAAVVSSCGTLGNITRGSQYARLYEENPITLLVMPPINNTTNVEAKEFLYTSISRPLTEAGYYVVSPMLAMEVFKAESAYDAELFVDAPLTQFQKFFGADAVVFSEILSWTKKGFGIETTLRYFIKSTHTGEILFDRTCELFLDLEVHSDSNSALDQLVSFAVSAINTATTEHIVAARKANYYIFRDIPRGKYSPEYMKDKEVIAEQKDIKARVE
ncbi:MAG: GNA1162 family protein [Bacteroidales bacterium]|jgi:hypothetical protein